MEPLTFSMSGLPRGKGRPRVNARGPFPVVHTDEKTRDYERSVSAIAIGKMAGRPPLRGPLSVSMQFRMPIPQSESLKTKARMASGEIAHLTRPDVDNMAKAILDAIACHTIPANKRAGTPKQVVPIVFENDCQIVRLFATKVYAANPGVDVRVEPLGEPS